MQYYSTKTKKLYDTTNELECAEKEYDKKQKEIEKAKNERSDAAKKVEALRQVSINARKAYEEELEKFCKKYGSYHTTLKPERKPDGTIVHRPEKIFEDLMDFTNVFLGW